MLVALPVTGLLASSLSGEPVAAADDAPAQSLPADGPDTRTPSAGPATPNRPAAAVARPAPTAAPKRAPSTTGGSPWRGRVPDRGSDRFRTAKVRGPIAGTKGRLLRYSVRVEHELPFPAEAVARQVQQILSDPRSWTGGGDRRLQLVPAGERTEFSVLIATPKTTDTYCLPLRTWGRLSCQDGPRAVLNARRWAFGATTYGKDVTGYRIYLVNHEVGHVLGRGHDSCPKRGAPAPIMVQQTKSLQGCRPNSWPAPRR